MNDYTHPVWLLKSHLVKPFQVRRLILLLIAVLVLPATASLYAQNSARVTLKMEDKTYAEVFDTIEQQTGYFFFYNHDQFDDSQRISVNVNGKSINQVLSTLFQGKPVSFELKDKNILLKKKSSVATSSQKQAGKGRTLVGIVVDQSGEPLPGVTVSVKGTTRGTVTDLDGNYSLSKVEKGQMLLFSFIGLTDKEVKVGPQRRIDVTMADNAIGLEEVVVVGYGVQKKVNLTASVSQVDSKIIANRPISGTAQGLQGAIPNLEISSSSYGGEPGSSMNMNIRGFMTSGGTGSISSSSPLILVDGVEMSINNVDPEDIETVSVLKDASAASIYGSRAAGGAIIITTKSGKDMKGGMKIAYSNNFSWSTPTDWPEQATALEYAYAMNDAAANLGKGAYWSEEKLGWIKQNMENPGSAPTLVAKSNGLDWDQSNVGIGATASTDWKDFLMRDWTFSQKHNINLKGGDQQLNYYVSAGYYDEQGILKQADEMYQKYNLDAKINAQPYKWLNFSLLTKFIRTKTKYPSDYRFGRGRIFDALSKLKPTLPTVDPTYGEPLIQAYYPAWKLETEASTNDQVVLLPRVRIEPIKDWIINLEYNYKRNNNKKISQALMYEYHRPNGDVAQYPSQDQTFVKPGLYTNEYRSPNLFTSYSKSYKGHNFKLMVGYQNEYYKLYNLTASAVSLLSDNIPSISTSVGEQKVDDGISHWSTESMFSRFNYDYKGKYLAEISYRRDGSSRFAAGSRWAGFPSFSAGYNVAKEDFWPLKDEISTFKVRGSYGTLGNQNVANYLYAPTISVNQGSYLFDGSWAYVAGTPDLSSMNLTWEKVKTTDFGFDISALSNRLTVNFDWYRTDISDMAAQGEALPAVLGTSAPLTNIGSSRVQGWETEISWRDQVKDFKYNVRLVLSDYKRTMQDYPNPNKLLSYNYSGKDLGEIWGLEWDGWYQTQDEIDNNEVDQSYIYGGKWNTGDTKYVDQNGDKKIDVGDNTLDDHGDLKVIGNTTPRYQFGINLGAEWRGFDLSIFIQGVGKKDYYMGSSAYRGVAQGPFHSNLNTTNIDYWRDETSALGANYNSFYPKPYSANPGQNNKNYKYKVNRYVADASYARLKSLQIGYTLPKILTRKALLDNVRIFISGENLLTVTDFPMYDPESVRGNFGNAIAYPLSKTFSTGINVSF